MFQNTHPFHTKPKALQWVVAILLFAICMIGFGILLNLTTENPLWYLLILPVIPVFQFCLTPFFKLTGTYTYLSPMLLVYNANEKVYDLHNGTGFDYFFVMRGTKSGTALRTKLLLYYLEGLLTIVEKIEKGELPETVEIHGTSYFFSKNTAKRFGFQIKKPSSYYRFNLYLNFFELLWMYSLSQGKLAFPKLNDIKKATTTGTELVSKKESLKKYRDFLRLRAE